MVISRTHRPAPFFSKGFATDDFYWEILHFHKHLYDSQLLKIFLAEVGKVGLNNFKQTIHHGCHSIKMALAISTFHSGFQATKVEECFYRFGINFLNTWDE